MPLFAYILLGIALFILILVFSCIRTFIVFDDSLKLYSKLWFIKFDLTKFLNKPKKIKKQKNKKTDKSESDITKKAYTEKEKSGILTRLHKIKTILEAFLKLSKKIHFGFFKLRINVACEDAATTALVYAGVTQSVSYIIELLRNFSNIDKLKNSDVFVNADFISQKSDFEAKIVIRFRIIDLIIFGLLHVPRLKKRSSKED